MPSPLLGTVPLEEISFDGNESENVSLFLQSVKRVAFAQGRQRDNEWLADYVETCLIDEALEWYDALDEKTQGDFKSLRTAMLQRFGRTSRIANIPSAPPVATQAPLGRHGTSPSAPTPSPSNSFTTFPIPSDSRPSVTPGSFAIPDLVRIDGEPFWKCAVRDWNRADFGRGLEVPLKHWEKWQYSGPNRIRWGSKYQQRQKIALEYAR